MDLEKLKSLIKFPLGICEKTQTVHDANMMPVAYCGNEPFGVSPEDAMAIAKVVKNGLEAFAVMMERGWYAVKDIHGTFFVNGQCKGSKFEQLHIPHPVDAHGNPHRLADPFTALVAAAAWYRANVESKS